MTESDKRGRPITAVIVGAGHRSMLYASLADEAPDMLRIVGVADPDPVKRRIAAEKYRIPENMQFKDAASFAAAGRIADAVINGTMDFQHVETAIPLLEAGYDMLLEKPFALNEPDIRRLYDTVKRGGNTVYICHVLRYAPFYSTLYSRIPEIGDIINIQLTEHVAYHHLVVSYVRGKWRSESVCGAGMLLAKCCHDMDLMMWFAGAAKPVSVSSFGGNFAFSEDKIPTGAGTRCYTDCRIEPDCMYSAKKHYIYYPDRWKYYVWDCFTGQNPTIEDKIKSLSEDNPYGKCVYRCGHDAVDHQSVMVSFDTGMTATLNMIGGAAKAERNVHIIGTRGEIKGIFDDSVFTVRKIKQEPGCSEFYTEETVDLKIGGDKTGMTGGHGGGDLRLVRDFVCALRGETTSKCAPSLDVSVASHLAVLRAERARKTSSVVSVFDKF